MGWEGEGASYGFGTGAICIGCGDAARYMLRRLAFGSCVYPGVGVGEFESCLDRLLVRLSFALGTGAGILNPLSVSLVGLLELAPFSVPVGA